MSVPELKVFVHGKSVAIGKTKFSIQFVTKHFPEEYDPEIEYTGRRTMTVDGKEVMVEISDISGGDDSLCAKYITAAHGLIFMYSLDWPDSLQALKTIYGEVTSLKKTNAFPFIIVANKCDLLTAEHQALLQEGKDLADSFHVPHFEVSAKTGANVQESVCALIRIIKTSKSDNCSVM